MAGRGLFNKLVDKFNEVADDTRRQFSPKDDQAKAAGVPGEMVGQESAADSARRVASDSGRQVGSDASRRVVTDGARDFGADSGRQLVSDDTTECRFCKTPNAVGAACAGCGATPDR